MPDAPAAAASRRQALLADGPINFSHITPRKLNAVIDEMIFANTINPDDAVTIMGSVTAYPPFDPDTPLDVRSFLDGAREFHDFRGESAAAAAFAGLIKRLDHYEVMPFGLSVEA